jgi:hypothetical protein
MWEEIVHLPDIVMTAITHFLDSESSLLTNALQLVSPDNVDGWTGR